MSWFRKILNKNKTRDYTAVQEQPEDRVLAFVSHWHKQWAEAKAQMTKNVDFELWERLVSEVDTLHFRDGYESGSKNSFGSPPEHHPEQEKIFFTEQTDSRAEVHTKIVNEHGSESYYVYLLMRIDNDWKITENHLLHHTPRDPVVEESKRDDYLKLASLDAPLHPPEEHLKLDENLAFTPRKVTRIDEELTIEVTNDDEFETESGIIGVMDFCYDIYSDEFEPLERSVPPGTYVIEVATIKEEYGRVAAFRLKLSDKNSVKWFAAKTKKGNGQYGVDAGNLAIFDVPAVFAMTHYEKETFCDDLYDPISSVMGDIFVSPSGYGDGCYPAFWGVDEEGNLASLYIDFMIMVEEHDGVYTSI